MRKLELGHGTARGWALGALLFVACVSSREPSAVGGESHFLRRCADSCGMGLDCIQGVCTRGCVVGKQSCGDLAVDAVCTAGSVEPGAVAVCDLECASDADCKQVSAKHRCEAGYCRADSVPSGAPDAGSGSTGGDAGGPTGSGYVVSCPKDTSTDPFQVERSVIVGDTLKLRLSYGGGCSKHAVSVCFDPAFRESYPVQTTLRVLHNAHDDTCEALLTSDHDFDLSLLAQAYRDGYQTNAGLISTNFGLYGFGRLMCEERTRTADTQLRSFEEQADHSCTTSADCTATSVNTRCTIGCGTVVSKAGAAEFESWLAIMEESVCRDYASDGCLPLGEVDCDMLKPACVAGKCQHQP